MGLFGFPKVVGKAAAKTPIFDQLAEEMEVIFVDKKSENSRQETLNAITAHCKGWDVGKRSLLIFPERTTTNGEEVIELRKGAFVPGAPVRPVIMVYNNNNKG